MHRPPRTSTPSSSTVPLLLAAIVLSAVVAILSLLTLGFFGVMLALALGLGAIIGLQYLLWGWWLGPLIRQSQAAREPVPDSKDE